MEILITNISLVTFGGSEIDTLTIAQYFKTFGHQVVVACFKYDYPMKKCFENSNIKVVALFEEDLTIKNYDLVWSHHSDILNYCIFKEKIEATKIVHHILSPYEYLESLTPYYKHISYYICNSEETKKKVITEGVEEDKIKVLSNSAPKEHFDYYRKNAESMEYPQKIAIISNHLAPEILAFSKKYQEIVDVIGIEGVQTEVNSKLLSNYNLVITIGKTVQFCFAQGIPVYCYDRFGGPGYITKDNIELAHKFNFSGRGFDCFKTLSDLEEDIFLCYKKHQVDLPFLHKYAKEYLNYNKNMDDVMKLINKIEGNVSLSKIRQEYAYLERVNLAFVREYHKNYLTEIAYKIAQGRIYFKKNGELQNNFIEIKEHLKNDNVMFKFDIKDFERKNIEALYFYPSYGHFIKSKILNITADYPVTWHSVNCIKQTNEADYYLCNDACYALIGDFNKINSLEILVEIRILDNSQFTVLVDKFYHELKLELEATKNIQSSLKLDLEMSKESKSKLKSDLKKQTVKIKKLDKQLQEKLKKIELLEKKATELERIKSKNIIQSILRIEEFIKKIRK